MQALGKILFLWLSFATCFAQSDVAKIPGLEQFVAESDFVFMGELEEAEFLVEEGVWRITFQNIVPYKGITGQPSRYTVESESDICNLALFAGWSCAFDITYLVFGSAEVGVSLTSCEGGTRLLPGGVLHACDELFLLTGQDCNTLEPSTSAPTVTAPPSVTTSEAPSVSPSTPVPSAPPTPPSRCCCQRGLGPCVDRVDTQFCELAGGTCREPSGCCCLLPQSNIGCVIGASAELCLFGGGQCVQQATSGAPTAAPTPPPTLAPTSAPTPAPSAPTVALPRSTCGRIQLWSARDKPGCAGTPDFTIWLPNPSGAACPPSSPCGMQAASPPLSSACGAVLANGVMSCPAGDEPRPPAFIGGADFVQIGARPLSDPTCALDSSQVIMRAGLRLGTCVLWPNRPNATWIIPECNGGQFSSQGYKDADCSIPDTWRAQQDGKCQLDPSNMLQYTTFCCPGTDCTRLGFDPIATSSPTPGPTSAGTGVPTARPSTSAPTTVPRPTFDPMQRVVNIAARQLLASKRRQISRNFTDARAIYSRYLTALPSVGADRHFEVLVNVKSFSTPDPLVFVALTEHQSLSELNSARASDEYAAFAPHFSLLLRAALVPESPSDIFDVATIGNSGQQVVEISLRRLFDFANFDAADFVVKRNGYSAQIAGETGFVREYRWRAVDADVFATFHVWESIEAFNSHFANVEFWSKPAVMQYLSEYPTAQQFVGQDDQLGPNPPTPLPPTPDPCDLSGGVLSITASPQYCTQTGTPTVFTPILTDVRATQPGVFIVTDSQNVVLSVANGITFEWDLAPAGTYNLYQAVFNGNRLIDIGQTLGVDPVSDSCSALSNALTFTAVTGGDCDGTGPTTAAPTGVFTSVPTAAPTDTGSPTASPAPTTTTRAPTTTSQMPTTTSQMPTTSQAPTSLPTVPQTPGPTATPPTPFPTAPTALPTAEPTTKAPTPPTPFPTAPTALPTAEPTTRAPTPPTPFPTPPPTPSPTGVPTSARPTSANPTGNPTASPTSARPTSGSPTNRPTSVNPTTAVPTATAAPTPGTLGCPSEVGIRVVSSDTSLEGVDDRCFNEGFVGAGMNAPTGQLAICRVYGRYPEQFTYVAANYGNGTDAFQTPGSVPYYEVIEAPRFPSVLARQVFAWSLCQTYVTVSEEPSTSCPAGAPDLVFDGPTGLLGGSVYCTPQSEGSPETPNPETCEILVLQLSVLRSQLTGPITGKLTLFSDEGSAFALRTEHEVTCFQELF